MPSPRDDPWMGKRMAAALKVARLNLAVRKATRAAMADFLTIARAMVLGGSVPPHLVAAADAGDPPPPATDPPPPRLDAWPPDPVWLELVDAQIIPVVAAAWGEEFLSASRGADITALHHRERYLREVHDRLVLWPKTAFEEIRLELQESISQGEDIRRQVERIGALLSIDAVSRRLQGRISEIERILDGGDLDPADEPDLRAERRKLYRDLDEDMGQWEWMAERIARTETMGALNGGAHAGAIAWSEDSGEPLFKQWLATDDERTRETHDVADGQVRPLGEPYEVGGFPLRHPGDPAGPGGEVIQCRCTELYLEADEAARETARYATKIESLQAAGRTPQEEAMPPAPSQLPIGWRGVLAPMGVHTGDGRMLAVKTAEELRLRDMPLVFSSQEALSGGHDGAVVTGNIETVWIGPGNVIGGSGRFDLGSDAGRETARLLHEGFSRWVSVDPDDIVWSEAWFDADGAECDPPTEAEWIAAQEALFDGEPNPLGDKKIVMRMDDYRLMGCTFVAQPAFNEAVITPVYDDAGLVPPEDVDVVARGVVTPAVASLVAGAGPLRPPGAWFTEPALTEPTPIEVDDDGRIRGHLATWDACHSSYGSCVAPPRSACGYGHFHVGAVITAEGNTLPVGKLTLGGGHAGPRATVRGALEHYDNAGTAVAVVRAYEDRFGIVVTGAVVPGVTEEQIAALRRSPLSGDWRSVGGQLELVAALAVNVPGFVVPRTVVASSAILDEETEETSLVAAGALPAAQVLARRAARIAARRATMDPAEFAAAMMREMNAQHRRVTAAATAALRAGVDPAARVHRAALRLAAVTEPKE